MVSQNYRQRAEGVANIVRDVGGEIIGRTRLQKIAYLLEVTGLGQGFRFEYRHYGPYSEDLKLAVQAAELLNLLDEQERPTSWGGHYSIYTAKGRASPHTPASRKQLASLASKADPVELELAATAVFLKLNGEPQPWQRTEDLKPDKAANGRLAKARRLYDAFREIRTPRPLPTI